MNQQPISTTQRIKAIIGGSIGNLVEWYDWYAYAAYDGFDSLSSADRLLIHILTVIL